MESCLASISFKPFHSLPSRPLLLSCRPSILETFPFLFVGYHRLGLRSDATMCHLVSLEFCHPVHPVAKTRFDIAENYMPPQVLQLTSEVAKDRKIAKGC